MPEENENLENENQEDIEEEVTETEKPDELTIPKYRFDQVNARMKAAEKNARDLEAKNKADKKKQLEENNQYKELYETNNAELLTLKGANEKLQETEEVLEEILVDALKGIPKDKQALIPDELSTQGKLRYITKNATLLSKSPPLNIGAGNKGGSEETAEDLTEEEKQVAKGFGMKESEYAQYKDKSE